MGRIRRNKEPLTTISIDINLKKLIKKQLKNGETINQRLWRMFTMASEDVGDYWYGEYLKVKKELLELSKQKVFVIQ